MLAKAGKPNLFAPAPAANAHLEPAIRSRIEALTLATIDQNWTKIISQLGDVKIAQLTLYIDIPNNNVTIALAWNELGKVEKHALIVDEATLPGIH